MAQKPFRTIVLEVARTDPARPARFEVPVPLPTSRVLDALLHVREHLDPTLGFRFSCRAGMCGSCAVIVNGREMLSCQATIADLGDVLRVAPLRALPVLRDLVNDMTPFFDSFKRVKGGLEPAEPGRRAPRTLPPGARDRSLIERHNGCLTCGACHSAAGTRPGHAGPAEINRVMMLALDERDARGKARMGDVAADARALKARATADLDRICPAEIALSEAIEACASAPGVE